MDVLSDVLSTVRLESGVFFRSELRPPWGIRAGPRDDIAFHVVARGRAWLDVEGVPGAVAVEAGDVVLLAPGRAHAVRDHPDSPAREVAELVAERAFCRPTDGDGDGATELVCGWFRFADERPEILLAALPPVLHARELATDAGPWLAQTVRLLCHESRAERPGTATVVSRLCDALFVYVLRSHLAALPPDRPSWLRGLVDPAIGRALELLHDGPAAPWSVAKLAAEVGMSRSAFAARFTGVVGVTPMRYLADWRLRRASVLLRTEPLSIDAIAARTGYGSAAAFSKAFARATGTAPGAYRRAAQVVAAQ